MRATWARLFSAALCLLLCAAGARAGEARVAVAANFAEAAKEIAALFEAATGHRAILAFGSTGQLYAQIGQAAPYDVFLAADSERPRLAAEAGLAVAGSRFTYAVGRLVLYSRDADLVTGEATLRQGRFRRLAIANPVTAPYGAAAVAALRRLGLYEALADKLVRGNSIAQAFQFVHTGNAELGLVALSQVEGRPGGSRWLLPPSLYPTLRQDAALLARGADNEAARAFLEFLRGPQASAVKAKHGYDPGD